MTSSNVSWIRYDQANEVLTIGYLNLGMYAYSMVTPQEAAAFLFASSKGRWCWDHLRVRGKGNAHRTQKPFVKL